MLQSQKIRNPFSLLQSEDDLKNLKIISVEKEQYQLRPMKKSAHLPFSKFEIKHETKQQKAQKYANKQTDKKKDLQAKKQQKSHHSSQKSQQNKQTHVTLKNDSNQQQTQLIKQASTSQSYQSTEYYEQQDDKKYLLTKKIREIKYDLNSDGDPPLLYDIGLEPEMIKDKLRLVLKLGEPDYDMIMNPDLAGPVAIAFAFGFLLLFSGQIQFGDIYALFIIGNLFLFVLFNFMARVHFYLINQSEIISLYNIMSILGYCLMPMLVLGAVGIFFKLNTGFGLIFSLCNFYFIEVISTWSSVAGGNFIQALLKGKKNRKLLIVYPLFLFYSSFAMMVIF